MDELLTVKELAANLKVPTSWVYRYSKETGPDAMPRHKVGKHLRFQLDTVLKWLEDKQVEEQHGA